MVQSTHEAWHLRLAAWWRTTESRLRRVWWLWPLIALILKLTEHRALTDINEFLDANSGLAVTVLKAIMVHVPSDPLVLTMILFLFVVGALVVHAYFDTRRRPVAPEGGAPTATATILLAPAATVPKAPTSAERMIISVTPEEIWNDFVGRTDVRAEQLISSYIGKWITVSGKLGNVMKHAVTFEFGRFALLQSLYMRFSDQRFKDKVATMAPGEQTNVLGRIAEVDRMNISLEDCELL